MSLVHGDATPPGLPMNAPADGAAGVGGVGPAITLTRQEMFDCVVEHLFAQGRPAMEAGNCLYRDELGRKCAVGCLIPDEIYDRSLEGRDVDSPMMAPLFPSSDRDFLRQLQVAHDGASLEENGEFQRWSLGKELRAIAKAFSLSAAALSRAEGRS